MKTVQFKIHYKEELPLDLSIEEIRKFPIYSHHLFCKKILVLIHQYKIAGGVSEEKYIESLENKFKLKYNADEIITQHIK